MNAAEAWERLEQPWREALELAWEAYTVQRISLQKLSGVLPVEGPLGGPFARISLALLASFIGEQDPSQFVAIAVAQERLAAARDDGAAVSRAGLRGLPLDKALPRLWDALAL